MILPTNEEPIKIINDDCLKVLKELPDECIDLCVTDPPYGIDYINNFNQKIEGDNINELNKIMSFLKICYNKMKNNTHIYVFISQKTIVEWITEFKKYFELKNILIIKRKHQSGGDKGRFIYKYEMCLFGTKGNRNLNQKLKCHLKSISTRNDPRNDGIYQKLYPDLIDFYHSSEFNLNFNHPTQKNIELIKFFIKLSSNENDLVLDLFLGGGQLLWHVNN